MQCQRLLGRRNGRSEDNVKGFYVMKVWGALKWLRLRSVVVKPLGLSSEGTRCIVHLFVICRRNKLYRAFFFCYLLKEHAVLCVSLSLEKHALSCVFLLSAGETRCIVCLIVICWRNTLYRVFLYLLEKHAVSWICLFSSKMMKKIFIACEIYGYRGSFHFTTSIWI
jgi:hypothetical protein